MVLKCFPLHTLAGGGCSVQRLSPCYPELPCFEGHLPARVKRTDIVELDRLLFAAQP